ncbi:MAG TPA: hypothetical protein VKU41_27200, partial [Polyangiaceae bacterium]|nr:hypothetical protein [Polyangiaceae bacterium]
MESNAPRAHPEQAIGVYAEPLVSDARVAVFGDASSGLAGLLVELGARSVTVFDPDETRSGAEERRAPPGVSVAPYPCDLRDLHGVDLAILPDLGLFDEPEEVVRVARRILGAEGVALIGAADREAAGETSSRSFDYYELFDLIASEFQAVRMVARLPFRGVALVELGEQDESPAVSVDTQLAEGTRRPEAFVALAGQQDVRLEPYAIIELPPASPATVGAERELLRAALAEAQLRAEVLERKFEDLQTRFLAAERAAQEASELEVAFSDRGRQLAELSADVEEMRAAAEAGRIAAAEVEELA